MTMKAMALNLSMMLRSNLDLGVAETTVGGGKMFLRGLPTWNFGRPFTLFDLDQAEATIMTYQNDLNTNRRSDISDDTSYTGWIIGGVVALAIVIAAVAFTSTGNSPDQPQTTTTVPAPTPSPSTTGSDTAPPTPANR
jgi:hypothetical protein